MRLAGGRPGAAHSAWPPGAAAPLRWVWDAAGEADVPASVGQFVLALAGASGLHAVADAAQAAPTTDAEPSSVTAPAVPKPSKSAKRKR